MNVTPPSSDRWMKNKYGGPLRQLVTKGFHLVACVDMTGSKAFHLDVTAYPAVTIIRREKPGPVKVVRQPPAGVAELPALAQALTGNVTPTPGAIAVMTLPGGGAEPWVLQAADQLSVLRRLEESFPTLEEAGCKVGIGVATGADRVFIGPYDALDVEPECKLPLVMTKDIVSGRVQWTGAGVVNPFTKDGALVNLAHYPRLGRYLGAHEEVVRNRNCARKNPKNWYRTIDRIYPHLAGTPKLLIPDIKEKAHIVYEEGRFYPHHNLYYIVSQEWDLKALRMVLLSDIAKLFVKTYSTAMRGGYLRFQAQYLRRIRLPRWGNVPEDVRHALLEAARREDAEAGRTATMQLYGITPREQAVLGENF